MRVVFIHGLWLHGESWQDWIRLFDEHGYDAVAANWPGDADTTDATRKNANALAGVGVGDIADHVAAGFASAGVNPIVIGHSMGGLIAQQLLGRGLAAAAIAIDPAPIKGVWELPLSTVRAAFPVLKNPFNVKGVVALTERQFRFAFANAVPEAEARMLHARYAMPAPARPLFEVATAAFNPRAATGVPMSDASRGPLLLVSGERDNTVPPVLVRSARRRYRKSPAITEFRMFAGRGHSLTIDSGWRDIAMFCLNWLRAKGF